jgi:GH43 family beta-xylosidase
MFRPRAKGRLVQRTTTMPARRQRTQQEVAQMAVVALPRTRSRRALTVVALAAVTALVAASALRAAVAPEGQTFSNPVLGQGQDPSLVYDGGWYYFIQSAPDTRSLNIRRSHSLRDLASAPKTVIWHGGDQGSPCCEWWAPELHRIGSSWYVYVAADDGNNDDHRLYVLRAATPLGPYSFVGKLTTPDDKWSIDGTVLTLPGQTQPSYLLWSGWPGDVNGQQNIYIARLQNPYTTVGPRTLLSTPTYPWELHSADVPVKVNEGPEAIVNAGRIFVTYSASGCWTPDYALGLLSAPLGSDLMQASSWTKSRQPVFRTNARAGVYGPAHNGFFRSPDGTQLWMAFHATNDPNGNCGLERNVWAQPVTFTADGTPQLGKPLSNNAVLPLPSGDPGAP